ncbi:MAG: hypothetical protein AB2730_20225, partial [Candidatus Thiodiazotropha sp.]
SKTTRKNRVRFTLNISAQIHMNIVLRMYLCFILVHLLLATGCTYHNPYHQGWSQINKIDDGLCGDICQPEGIFIKLPTDWSGPNDGLPAVAVEKR